MMIKVEFLRDQSGRIQTVEFEGHANAAPYGSDIVCASVSALAISTINGIDALAGITPQVQVNEEDGGYLKCQIDSQMTQEQMNISQILLENLYIAINTMQEEYDDYIQVKTIHLN